MDINEEDYQKIGESYQLVEMGQFGLDLSGAIMKKNIIDAGFGTAQIQNIRRDQTILYSKNLGFRVYQQISRVNIVKSNKPKQSRKENEKKVEEGEELREQMRGNEESDEILYQESEQVKEKKKQKKKMINKGKRKINERKELKRRINQLNKRIQN